MIPIQIQNWQRKKLNICMGDIKISESHNLTVLTDLLGRINRLNFLYVYFTIRCSTCSKVGVFDLRSPFTLENILITCSLRYICNIREERKEWFLMLIFFSEKYLLGLPDGESRAISCLWLNVNRLNLEIFIWPDRKKESKLVLANNII